MNNPEWLLIFFVAIAIGYLLGLRDGRRRQARRSDVLSSQYLKGLNFLLNEEPDRAVEIFVNSLDVNENTVDTHMALARLFRKRGEFDRATLIHNALLESGKLPGHVRDDVELELARDYIAGGLLDRAEFVLQQMLDRGSHHNEAAMRALMNIFEQERDWHSALSIGERLLGGDGSIGAILAHYCCELAEQMTSESQHNAARRTLRRALGYDHDCVRASVLLGRLEKAGGHYDSAARAFRRIRRQDRAYFDLVLDDLEAVYEAMDRGEDFTRYLAKVCVEQPGTAVVLKLAERLRVRYGERAASLFIADYMKANPSVKGLDEIVNLNLDAAEGQAREHLGIVKQLTAQLLAERPTYQCAHCGFEAQRIHWQCPSCKHWGSVRPLTEGENRS